MGVYPDKEKVIRQYDTHRWAEQADVGKHIFIWKFFMSGKEIPRWKMIKAIPEQTYQERRISSYLWQRVEGNTENLVRIDIVESSSWPRAQEILSELLLEYQAPRLREASSLRIELGDVALLGLGEPIQSAIFQRANITSRIHSVGKRDVSVVDVAKQTDKLFLTKPQLSEKGVVPEIESFSAETTTAKIDEIVTLNIKARDPLDRRLWYKLMVDQGEFLVRNENLCFSTRAHGQPEISLFAINEDGFVAGTTLSIKIQ